MIARIGLTTGFLLLTAALVFCADSKWQSTLTSSSPPTFPNPRPMQARYGFGWSGFPCATAEIRLSKGGDRIQLDATARTIGLARALWKFDATHTSSVDAETLRPIAVRITLIF